MRRVHLEKVVPVGVEKVWWAWTTSEGIASFFCAQNWIELKLGGAFEVYFLTDNPRGSQGSEGCRVLTFVPERMLVFSWNAPPHLPGVRGKRTWVTLFFHPMGDGFTRVELIQLGWGDGLEWDQAFDYFISAWDRVLENLEASFK